MNELPEILLDNEGYPTPEWINYINSFDSLDERDLLVFCNLLSEGWHFNIFGYNFYKYAGVYKLELHTAGWSGNEEIIEAILKNNYLSLYRLRYVKWIIGGHYYFEMQ